MRKEPTKRNSESEQRKSLLTIRLLIVSMTIYLLTFFIVIFSQQFGLSDSNLMDVIPILLLVALAINIAGFVFGISERKENFEMAVNGIVGNVIPIIIAVICLVYLINAISSLGPLFD